MNERTASVDRAVGVRHGPVARLAFDRQAQPRGALLRGLNRVERLAEDLLRKSADFAECVFCTDQVGVLVDEEQAPFLAAGFFVGDAGEDHVAVELALADLLADQDEHLGAHRRHVLHVDRAAAPEVAVVDLSAERVVPPLARVGFDHVEVRVEQDRRLAPVALDARDDVGAASLGLEDDGLDLRGAEALGEQLGRGALVAVPLFAGAAVDGGNAQEVGEQAHAARAASGPVDRVHRAAR